MPNFFNLPPFADNGDVHVVVETPRGSRAKFAYDPKLESFALRKSLLTGLSYPHDWGFVPSTKADDGDPLDIMVIHDAATFPGLMVECRCHWYSSDRTEEQEEDRTQRSAVCRTSALAFRASPKGRGRPDKADP
jgi:inorganic pyrophosphatase